MSTIIICDDVEMERQMLHELLLLYFEETKDEVTILEYESGESLIADVEEGYLDADLLFLDIYMKKMNGMEVARRLRKSNHNGPIVFLTASPDFAIESYEVQASGYILKPFDVEKIKELTGRLLKREQRRRVEIKSRRQYRYPYTDEIIYAESEGHLVRTHLLDGSEIIAQEKLGDLENRISERRFLRCHQSYLVNMDYISDAEEGFVLKDGTDIPIRVRGRKEILESYHKYFMGQQKINE